MDIKYLLKDSEDSLQKQDSKRSLYKQKGHKEHNYFLNNVLDRLV